MGILYIVATPIGNLEDISKRALRILSEVYLILCEDTRVSQKLLEHYNIRKPLISYHQHSKLKKIEEIVRLLEEGRNLALICDAGTPGISDPGNKLIQEVTKLLSNQVKIIPIPGPSAVTAAASISGMAMDKFLFLGFPPAKKKRKKFFEEVANSRCPVIFYESPYRILKTLKELNFFSGKREVVVCRELTKKFETVYRGDIEDIVEEIGKDAIKGEFVVTVEGKK